MDAPLQAHLGRSPLPRLRRPPHDLVQRHEKRRAAQVLGELALREGAEAAPEVADVRVLDVSRHDVRDLVAADLAPQPIRGREDALALATPGGEEPLDLVPAELFAGQLQRERVTPDDERDVDRLPRRPTILAREAERVSRAPHRGPDGGVDPAVEVGDVLRIQRQARSQRQPARRGRVAQQRSISGQGASGLT